MNDRDEKLLAILKIGHDASMRGTGISLHEALLRTNYHELRVTFGPTDLIPLIRENESLVAEWIAYSEDKRTNGGWYLLRNGQIGNFNLSESRMQFESIEQAVADYVVRELDFWDSVNAGDASS